jgi:3-isopropylmalate dehydrogenase
MDALITLLPGDGIGPEVTKSGRSILDTIGKEFGHNFSFSEQHIGGSGIDHCNDPLPSDTISSCNESNAVILGAVGGPKWDNPNAKLDQSKDY